MSVRDSDLQEDTPLAQKISPVASNLDSSILVISVKTEEDFVVRETLFLLNDKPFWSPCFLNFVIILTIDRRLLVDNVMQFRPNLPHYC